MHRRRNLGQVRGRPRARSGLLTSDEDQKALQRVVLIKVVYRSHPRRLLDLDQVRGDRGPDHPGSVLDAPAIVDHHTHHRREAATVIDQ